MFERILSAPALPITALLLSTVIACGDDAAPDAGMDAGPSDRALDAGRPVDAAVRDAGRIDAAPADAGPTDTGPGDSGESDAEARDTGLVDAGDIDAGDIDAGVPDSGLVDAGPAPRLYAIINDQLAFIGTSSGTFTVIGPTNIAGINRLASGCGNTTVFGIYDNPGNPKVVELDVCTGEATHLTNLSIPGNFVDGLDCNPTTQELYASVSANGNWPGDGLAEHIVALDPYTGTSTSVGDLTGGLLDADTILLTLSSPVAIDADSQTNTIDVYDLDTQTLITSNLRSSSPRPSRMAVHEGVVYGLGVGGAIDGQIVTVDTAAPSTTPIGGAYNLLTVGGLTSGPGCD